MGEEGERGDGGEKGLTENERAGIELLREGEEAGEQGEIWLRPAHDGLRVRVTAGGRVEDGTYGS